MSGVPRGIPTVTYARISQQSGWIDVVADGPTAVTVLDAERPASRHDVTQVLDRHLNDEEVCEHTIGTLAGASLGVALNPVSAFVLDAATSVIVLVGSQAARKWQFLKTIFLKFLANELYANQLADKEAQALGAFTAQVSVSAFEVNNEVITDLLRPAARGCVVTLSRCHVVTLSRCHVVTLSRCHVVTLSRCHVVTLSRCHVVICRHCFGRPAHGSVLTFPAHPLRWSVRFPVAFTAEDGVHVPGLHKQVTPRKAACMCAYPGPPTPSPLLRQVCPLPRPEATYWSRIQVHQPPLPHLSPSPRAGGPAREPS